MPKKKPYFPNNWKAYKDAPEECFATEAPLTFEEFMDWKIAGWEIPSSVSCIIRERNLKTDKVKEYVYQKEGAAQRKLKERMASGECEFTVCHADAIHLLRPNIEDPYDDPLA